MTASQTPWEIEHTDDEKSCDVFDANGNVVATQLRPDDAALIVRAVNEREGLIEALEAGDRYWKGVRSPTQFVNGDDLQQLWADYMEKMSAALTKARQP